MFGGSKNDKSKDKKPSNPAHLGEHITGFMTDLFVRGGTKEDFEANFKAKTWKGKPGKDKRR